MMNTCPRCYGAILTGVTNWGGPICTCPITASSSEPQQVGWMVVTDINDASAAALYPMRDTQEAIEAAKRWKGCLMAVFTGNCAPVLGTAEGEK